MSELHASNDELETG